MVLHREIWLAVELAGLVERADVGMVQRRGRAGLTEDAIGGSFCGRVDHDFQGDETIEPGVARPVDVAHATGADRLEHFD